MKEKIIKPQFSEAFLAINVIIPIVLSYIIKEEKVVKTVKSLFSIWSTVTKYLIKKDV